MHRYYLNQVADLFKIDPSTLRRWRQSAGIEPQRSPGDYRRRWLSRDQVALLSVLHGKVIVQVVSTEEMVRDLAARVESLEATVGRLAEKEETPR
jgi:DNA-binding transcriptional MerR regulator